MSQLLMQCLPEVDEKLRAARRIALFLDFDGTLAPIVPDPAVAKLSADTCSVLQQIARSESIVTSVISGRAVEDVYVRIHIDGIIYAGNHGMEIFGRGLRFIEPEADARRQRLRRIAGELAEMLRHLPGVLVEDKGLTASVHFRNAGEGDVPTVEGAVRSTVFPVGDQFRVNRGRKVLEILPRIAWHKGAAVRWILNQLHDDAIAPVYLGDDSTDEDAFAELDGAVTVRVGGPPETAARYRVPDPVAVREFLLWLTNRTGARPPA